MQAELTGLYPGARQSPAIRRSIGRGSARRYCLGCRILRRNMPQRPPDFFPLVLHEKAGNGRRGRLQDRAKLPCSRPLLPPGSKRLRDQLPASLTNAKMAPSIKSPPAISYRYRRRTKLEVAHALEVVNRMSRKVSGQLPDLERAARVSTRAAAPLERKQRHAGGEPLQCGIVEMRKEPQRPDGMKFMHDDATIPLRIRENPGPRRGAPLERPDEHRSLWPLAREALVHR